MNDYRMWIPVVNRFDLLDKAVESAKDMWKSLTIIDNSPSGLEHPYPEPLTVFRPPVPLSCPQYFNFMMQETRRHGANICIWMHSDAEALEGSCLKLLSLARELNDMKRKWGIVFTNYDALSAMNTDMTEDVGLWDTFFNQYFCDGDFHRRARLAGYEMINSDIAVNHIGSQTLHSDPERQLLNGITFPLYHQYYLKKWGSDPGSETFLTPFNR